MSILVDVMTRPSVDAPWVRRPLDLQGTAGVCVGDHEERHCVREGMEHIGGVPSKGAAHVLLLPGPRLSAGFRSTQPDWTLRLERDGRRTVLSGGATGILALRPGDLLTFGPLVDADSPSHVKIRVRRTAALHIPGIPSNASGAEQDRLRREVLERLRRGLVRAARTDEGKASAHKARTLPLLAVLAFELSGPRSVRYSPGAVTEILGIPADSGRNNLRVTGLRALLIRILDNGDGVTAERRERMLVDAGLPAAIGLTTAESIELADRLRMLGALEEPALIEWAQRAWLRHLVRVDAVPEDPALAVALELWENPDAPLFGASDAMLPEFEAAIEASGLVADAAGSWSRVRAAVGGRLCDALELGAPAEGGARGVLALARDIVMREQER